MSSATLSALRLTALCSGIAGPKAQRPASISYLLVLISGLAGLAGTFTWWQTAHQT